MNETSPSFEERVAAFLLSRDGDEDNRAEAEALYDMLQSAGEGSSLHSTFEDMARMHNSLESLFRVGAPASGLTIDAQAEAPVGKPPRFPSHWRAWAAAILAIASLGLLAAIPVLTRGGSPERLAGLQFGRCTAGETRIEAGADSLCDFSFRKASAANHGRNLHVRLHPHTSADVSLVDDSWQIDYHAGTILIESSKHGLLDRLWPGAPQGLNVHLGTATAEFLGTRVRIRPDVQAGTALEVLDGEVRLTSEARSAAPADGPLVVSRGSMAVIHPTGEIRSRSLNQAEQTDLEKSFDSTLFLKSRESDRADSEGLSNAKTPARILFPEATEIPGNRIITTDGAVHEGISLFQNGDVYILITGSEAREFPAASVRRIEFQ